MADEYEINVNEPPPDLTREDLWRRYFITMSALRHVRENGYTEWAEEVITRLIGPHDVGDPILFEEGSLADLCDAALTATDPNAPEDVLDRLPCILRRGHLDDPRTPEHITVYGETFDTDEARPAW